MKLFLVKFFLFFLSFSQSDKSLLRDLEKIELEKESKKEIFEEIDSIEKDLSFFSGGNISSFYTTGDISTRHSSKLHLFLEKRFSDLLNLKLSFRIINAQISNTVKIERKVKKTLNGVSFFDVEKSNLEKKVSNFEIEARDLYFKITGDYWDLVMGYQTYSLGQADIVSPIDFLIVPNRSDSLGLTLNKLDEKLSQPIVQFSFNKSHWQLSYYYHPLVVIDKFKEKKFSQTIYNQYTLDGKEIAPEKIREEAINPEIPKEKRHLVKLLYFGKAYTLGFNYYKGLALAFINNTKAVVLKDNKVFSEITLEPNFDKIEMLAFEASFTRGAYRYFTEFGFIKGCSVRLPNFLPYYENTPPPLGEDRFAENTPENNEYYNFIYKNNNQLLSLKSQDVAFCAIGIDYRGKRYDANLYLLGIFSFLNSFGEKVQEVYNRAIEKYGRKDELGEQIQRFIFPTFNLSYFFNDEKESALGIVGGTLTTARGYGIYYSNSQGENFSWSLIFSILRFNNDENIFKEEKDDIIKLSFDSEFTPNFTLSLSYAF